MNPGRTSLERHRRVATLLFALLAAGSPLVAQQAEYPRPGRTPHDRAIRELVGEQPLDACVFESRFTARGRDVISFKTPLTLRLGAGYKQVIPEAIYNGVFLDGRYGKVWEWRPDFGLRSIETWFDARSEDGFLQEYVLQVAQSDSYLRFAPGPSWNLVELHECWTSAGDRPARVFLFTARRPDGAAIFGLEAFWRTSNASKWVSVLGLGSHPESQAEFLTIIQGAR